MAEKGVEVRMLNVRELGRIRLMDVKGQVDEQTRLVALASCHFLSGFRIDLEGIGNFLRERNVLFSCNPRFNVSRTDYRSLITVPLVAPRRLVGKGVAVPPLPPRCRDGVDSPYFTGVPLSGSGRPL